MLLVELISFSLILPLLPLIKFISHVSAMLLIEFISLSLLSSPLLLIKFISRVSILLLIGFISHLLYYCCCGPW